MGQNSMGADTQLEQAVLNAALKSAPGPEGKKRLSCSRAFSLAKEFDVEPMQVGKICNRHDIKISACQLGCF